MQSYVENIIQFDPEVIEKRFQELDLKGGFKGGIHKKMSLFQSDPPKKVSLDEKRYTAALFRFYNTLTDDSL